MCGVYVAIHEMLVDWLPAAKNDGEHPADKRMQGGQSV